MLFAAIAPTVFNAETAKTAEKTAFTTKFTKVTKYTKKTAFRFRAAGLAGRLVAPSLCVLSELCVQTSSYVLFSVRLRVFVSSRSR
jgi:hypothetical protein